MKKILQRLFPTKIDLIESPIQLFETKAIKIINGHIGYLKGEEKQKALEMRETLKTNLKTGNWHLWKY